MRTAWATPRHRASHHWPQAAETGRPTSKRLLCVRSSCGDARHASGRRHGWSRGCVPHAFRGAVAPARSRGRGPSSRAACRGRPRLCADQPGPSPSTALGQEGLTLPLPHTPASGAPCGLAGRWWTEALTRSSLLPQRHCSCWAQFPLLRSEARPRTDGSFETKHKVGMARQPEPGMEGLSGMGGRGHRAGPQEAVGAWPGWGG